MQNLFIFFIKVVKYMSLLLQNNTVTHGELSCHSVSECAPQAYHFHLMNGIDWIGRQAWGEKGAEGK